MSLFGLQPLSLRWARLIGLGLVVCAGLAGAQASVYTDIVVFGDSLSDVGNTANDPLIRLLSPQAQPPYYQGRFSNGPVWIETLAAELGLNASVRSTAGGNNYAWGGALSGTGTNTFGLIDNVGRQVSDYLGANAPSADTLYVLWAGGNDLIASSSAGPTVASNTTGHLTTLANAGAERFLVLNLPDLGVVPRFVGGAQSAEKSAASTQHNTLLAGQLDAARTTLGVDITLMDIQSLFGQILANPARYGFSNTTAPAYNPSAGTVASQPNTYAFWDDIHPTAASHDWIAAATYVALQKQGDFTADGIVDQADLDRVLQHFGSSATPFELDAGDWTGDGRVDQRELSLVLRSWTGAAPPVLSAPEPASILVLTAGLWILAGRRNAGSARGVGPRAR